MKIAFWRDAGERYILIMHLKLCQSHFLHLISWSHHFLKPSISLPFSTISSSTFLVSHTFLVPTYFSFLVTDCNSSLLVQWKQAQAILGQLLRTAFIHFSILFLVQNIPLSGDPRGLLFLFSGSWHSQLMLLGGETLGNLWYLFSENNVFSQYVFCLSFILLQLLVCDCEL